MSTVAHVFHNEEEPVELGAHRPIDMVHLSRQSLGDPGIEEEILRMFDQMAGAYVSRLRGAVNSGDILLHLHSLKGASAGVGAFSIAALAAEAEKECSAMGKLSVERLADITIAVEEVRVFIAELLDD